MIVQPLWKKLKALVEIDNNARELKEKIKGELKDIEKNKISIPQIQKEIERLLLDIKEIRKKVDAEELTAKDLKEKEESKREALDKTTNEKEYRAIGKEIKRVTQERMGLEDILIQTWHKYDQTKKEAGEQTEQKNKQIEEIKEKTTELENSLKEYEQKLEKIIIERQEAAKDIPEEWLRKYERMKENVQNPVVPVIQDGCSACFYHIIRQDLQRLKNHGMLLCRNCYRFLYYDKEEEEETDGETKF